MSQTNFFIKNNNSKKFSFFENQKEDGKKSKEEGDKFKFEKKRKAFKQENKKTINDIKIENKKLFAILNISPGASEKEIKRSYKRIALKYHPDKHMHRSSIFKKEQSNKFIIATEAYHELLRSNGSFK